MEQTEIMFFKSSAHAFDIVVWVIKQSLADPICSPYVLNFSDTAFFESAYDATLEMLTRATDTLLHKLEHRLFSLALCLYIIDECHHVTAYCITFRSDL